MRLRIGPSRSRPQRTSPTTPSPSGAFDSVYMDATLEVFEQNTDFGKELLNNAELRDVMRRWILPLARRKAAEKHLRPRLPLDE